MHSIRRFGRLVTASQETKLVTIIREETDPEVRASLVAVFRVLVPTPTRGTPKSLTSAILPESSETAHIPTMPVAKPPRAGANP